MRVKTKVLSALFSTLIIGAAWLIFGIINEGRLPGIEDFGFVMMVMVLTAVGNFVYGIPISLLSDWISDRVPSFRFIIAAFIHLSMAVVTFVAIEGLYVFAVIAAVFFFIAEEWQHRKLRTFRVKMAIGNTLVVFALLFGIWELPQLEIAEKTILSQLDIIEETNRTYLIPEGYEGTIVVLYNMPGEEELEKENDRDVVSLHIAEQVYTYVGDVVQYAEARTSSARTEGEVTDTYYYSDEEDERTAIDEECIHRGIVGDVGPYEENAEYEILQVTHSFCGLDFMRYGSDVYERQEEKIMSELFTEEE
ncbi:DUF6843 domain-containing protein [Guptibacillus algicola]|uniref:DUF6843 domain-containing protein n=1 Tax=Guptibacillus algicola TaxID=225844 RepID=UPI001CD6E16E|nr:hypothetical protein [Alkalihalobacillus algicola]MCA0987220.1 hypothetical protein [Alkalihalobacillus algicola]